MKGRVLGELLAQDDQDDQDDQGPARSIAAA
jgi:hypothetical protein